MAVQQSLYHPTDCNAVLAYVNNSCPTTENGGIRNFILVDKYYQDTLVAALDAATTQQQHYAAWNTAKQAGKLIIVSNVLGDYDGSSPVESQGYGGASMRETGKEHVVTLDDVNAIGNSAFANSLPKANKWVLWFSSNRLIWNTKAPAGMSTTMPIDRDYNSEVKYVYTMKWSHPELPEPYWNPGELFDETSFSGAVTNVSLDNTTGPNFAAAFLATFEQACPLASSGSIRLIGVEYDNGTVVAVASGYALTGGPVAITAGDVSKALPTTGPATPLAAGTYIYSFGISGCGRTVEQVVESYIVIS